MNTKDQQTLEQLYSKQVLEEGVWDQIKHKASNAAGALGGMASNVGNRLANVVRSPENQVNPQEAQVQALWNSFRNKSLKAIENYLKKQSTLLSTEEKANSSFTKQLNAIKEAQKFLQDPPNYIKKNPAPATSASSSTSAGGGSGSAGGAIESGSKDGSSAVSSAPSPSRVTTSDPASDPGRGTTPSAPATPASAPATPASTGRSGVSDASISFTSPPSSISIKPSAPKSSSSDISGTPKVDYNRLPGVVSNLKKTDPKKYNDIKAELEKIFAENSNFKNHFKLALLEADTATRRRAKASTPKPEEKDEDVRLHGTHPLSVETMKFFSEFRGICEQFIHNFDKIKRVGEFGKSANRRIFTTADTFLKRLLLILYIPKAGDLQGANPFKDKMK